MNVYIYLFRRNLQHQHTGGELSDHDQILIGVFQSYAALSGSNISAVDKEILKRSVGTGVQRLSHKTSHLIHAVLIRNRYQVMSELFPQNGINCSVQVTAAVGTEFRSVIPYHAKCDFWV